MANLRENKIIILARLETGDEVTVSVKVMDKQLTNDDRMELIKKFNREITPVLDDTIYFTIRTFFCGKKDNWKLNTVKEVLVTVDEIFKGILNVA